MKREEIMWRLGLFATILGISYVSSNDQGSLFDREPNFGASLKLQKPSKDPSSQSIPSPRGPDDQKRKEGSRSLFTSGSEKHEIIARPPRDPSKGGRGERKEPSYGQYTYKKTNEGSIAGQSTDSKNTQIIINLNHEPKSYVFEQKKESSLFDKPLKDSYGQLIEENEMLNMLESAKPPAPPPSSNSFDDYEDFEELLAAYDAADYISSIRDEYFYDAGEEDSSEEASRSYLPPSADSFDIEDVSLPSYGSFYNKKSRNRSKKEEEEEEVLERVKDKRRKLLAPPVPPPNKYSTGNAAMHSQKKFSSKEDKNKNIMSPAPPTDSLLSSNSDHDLAYIPIISPPAPPTQPDSNPSRIGTFDTSSSSSFSQSPFTSSSFSSFPSTNTFQTPNTFTRTISNPTTITRTLQNPSTFTRTLQNPTTITKTLQSPSAFSNSYQSLSNPSSVITYTSRTLSSNSFPSLPIPPPSSKFSNPSQSTITRFSSPTLFGPPAPPVGSIGPPSPPPVTVVRPPSPSVTTVVRPPSPPSVTTVVRPPSPSVTTVVRPPSPSVTTVVRPPSPPTIITPSVTSRPTIVLPPSTIEYTTKSPQYLNHHYAVPQNLSIQIQIVHRTSTPKPNTESLTTPDDPKPSYKPPSNDQQQPPQSNNIEYHVHVNSVEQLAEITKLFGSNKGFSSASQPILAPESMDTRAPSYKVPSDPRPTYEAPSQNPRPTYEAPLQNPRPTFEAPSQNPRPTYEAPLQNPRPTYEAPSQNPRPTYEALSQNPRPTYNAPLLNPRPLYKAPPPLRFRGSRLQSSPLRPSNPSRLKSNYYDKRKNKVSSPRVPTRTPNKLQEILRLKCVFLCQFRQVEFQEEGR